MNPLFFRSYGNSNSRTLVFLHGFLETHQVWNELAQALASQYHIVTLDLPGFGESHLLHNGFSIQEVATAICQNLSPLANKQVTLIGHSLGGYVALAMAAQQPEKFEALVLLHSTAYADTPEKKEARTRTIDFIERNGMAAFTTNFVSALFANRNHGAIPQVIDIATKTKLATAVGYLAAMRDRPDSTEVLTTYVNPIFFWAGEKDTIIPIETLKKQVKMAKKGILCSLAEVAHMGMFEAPETILQLIHNHLPSRVD